MRYDEIKSGFAYNDDDDDEQANVTLLLIWEFFWRLLAVYIFISL